MPALVDRYLEWSSKTKSRMKANDAASNPEPTANDPLQTRTTTNEPTAQDSNHEQPVNPEEPDTPFDPDLDYNHPIDLEENENMTGTARRERGRNENVEGTVKGGGERVWEVLVVDIFGAFVSPHQVLYSDTARQNVMSRHFEQRTHPRRQMKCSRRTGLLDVHRSPPPLLSRLIPCVPSGFSIASTLGSAGRLLCASYATCTSFPIAHTSPPSLQLRTTRTWRSFTRSNKDVMLFLVEIQRIGA